MFVVHFDMECSEDGEECSYEEEVEFDIEIDNRNIQPYMFEPLASDDSGEDGITAATSSSIINEEDTHRLGEIDW